MAGVFSAAKQCVNMPAAQPQLVSAGKNTACRPPGISGRIAASAGCFLASGFAFAAEGTRPSYTPPPPAVSSGSIAQIIFSLLLVLAAIILVAWLLKRMNVAQQSSGSLLKVLGSVAVGQRERIVLVEVNDTCLVVGVGPGQIRTLHSFQKTDDLNIDLKLAETRPAENKFAQLLSSVLGQRKQGTESK